jgi:hypothetical protein
MSSSIVPDRIKSATRSIDARRCRGGIDPVGRAAWATVLCLLSGCATYYEPNAHNIPLFQEKGEVRVAAGINEGSAGLGHTDGKDFQGAYAVTDHVGVMVNMFFTGNTDDLSGDTGKGRLVECGAGYYSPVTDHFVFETYGGAGLGRLTRSGTLGQTSVSARRVFLQPSLGYASRGFDAALSLRVCGLTYYGIPEHSVDDNGRYMAQELKAAGSSLLAEPALTLRAGWEPIKLQLQAGLSRNLTHPDFAQGDSYMSLGVYVTGKNRDKTAVSVPRPPETGR